MAGSIWFRPEGDGIRATGFAVSPHAPGVQHGSAVAAIVARAAEKVPSAVPMDIARITVDLSRAVPVGLVTTTADVRRDGKRLQMIDITVVVDGAPVTRSEVHRIRHEAIVDGDDLAAVPAELLRPPVPGGLGLTGSPWPDNEFMSDLGCTFERYEPGRGIYSYAIGHSIVEGEALSPGVRAAIASDLVMSAGGLLPGYQVVNTDITLSMHRMPVGSDITIDSSVHVNRSWGASVGALYDGHGRFGTATKSLIVLGRRGVHP